MKRTEMMWHLLRNKEISVKKVLNLIRNAKAYLFKNPNPKGYPSILIIEPTNICNLKCPMCVVGNGSLKRKKGCMSFEDYKNIIDECGDYLMNVTLFFYGEPFLNKDIFRMIEYTRKKRIFNRVSTNALPLDSREKIRELIKSGLDYLIVSFDGATEETYKKYRVGGEFKRVINNLKMLAEEKRKMKSKLPYLELQFIVMSYNQHEIEEMKRLAKEIGADHLRLKTLNITEGIGQKEIGERIKYLPNEAYSRYKVEGNVVKPKNKAGKGCIRPWLTSVIDWEGTVILCCFDTFNSYTFGNVFDKGFMPIWNNKKYTNIRKDMLKNKSVIPICRECSGNLLDEEDLDS